MIIQRGFFLQRLVVILLLGAVCLHSSPSYSEQGAKSVSRQRLSRALEAIIDPNLLDSTAILARDLGTAEEIFAFNAEAPLKPASVLKLATSTTALRYLGPEFQWKTKVEVFGLARPKARLISVRGVGDPSLTIESLWILARRLRKEGIESVETINLDESAFVEQKNRIGARAYEGGSSALAFNFNSVGIEICPGKVGSPARITIDPLEAGSVLEGRILTTAVARVPLEIEDVTECQKAGCALTFRASGSITPQAECFQEYRSVERPVAYLGQVFQRLLRQLGIGGAQKITYQIAPSDPNFSFSHASKSLREVLVGLNNFSTNVTAEQLLYAIGEDGERYSSQLGLTRVSQYLVSLGVDKDQMQIVDGSGLSHENRLSASAIVRILERQYQDPETATEFQGSLSIWGRSGTLKKRKSLPEGVVVRGKTGSLDGVSSLAGYLYRKGKAPIAFAILQNRVASKAKAVDIEDEAVEYLALNGFS